MRVLLCQDVEKLGWLGDVVEVGQGYARNYLLPNGLAIRPTETNLRSLAKEKAKRAQQRNQEKARLQETAKAVQGAEAVIAKDANEQGRLFGSVDKQEIAENLREQGFEVADEAVQLTERIKQTGTSEVKLKFAQNSTSEGRAEDLTATVNVTVVALRQQDREK